MSDEVYKNIGVNPHIKTSHSSHDNIKPGILYTPTSSKQHRYNYLGGNNKHVQFTKYPTTSTQTYPKPILKKKDKKFIQSFYDKILRSKKHIIFGIIVAIINVILYYFLSYSSNKKNKRLNLICVFFTTFASYYIIHIIYKVNFSS